MQGPQRKLAAILIADPVGPARHEGDPARLHAARADCRAIVDDLARSHGGRVLEGEGERVVALFPTATGAVGAAMAVQAALAQRNGAKPDRERTLYRIGIDTVDIEEEGGRRVGEGLAVAMALSAQAVPGGLCVAGGIFDQVRDRLALRYTDAGEQALEGVPHPVRVYRVGTPEREADAGLKPRKRKRRGSRFTRVPILLWVAAGLVAYLALQAYQSMRHEAEPTSAEAPAVAVLPFDAPAGAPEDDLLGDAVAQDLAVALGRFPTLAVLAHEAVLPFDARPVDMQALRTKLGARYVVNGTLRRENGRLLAQATLTDTADGREVFTRTYEDELGDAEGAALFRMEDDIVRRIAGALGLALKDAELERTRAKPPATLEAYELLARANALLAQKGAPMAPEARATVQRALELDPGYAAAHVALAATFAAEGTDLALPQAEAAARAALDLDPESAAAHRMLAAVYRAEGDVENAVLQAQQAIRLNASDAPSHALLGTLALWRGEGGEAVTSLEPALRLDPALAPEIAPLLGFAYALSDRYTKCVDLLALFVIERADLLGEAALALCYAELDRIGEARAAAARALALWPAFDVATFANAWSHPAARDRVAGGLRKAGFE